MEGLPEGTLTFLFTDLEGSTRAWEGSPGMMRQAMARHDQIIAEAVDRHHGVDVHSGRAGDSTLTVFRRATDAAACALAIQLAFARERWPADGVLKVRVALHTGEAELRENQYYGQPLNRCARLMATGHGGQTLLTQATEELLVDDLPARAGLRDLGFHRLKDLARPEHIFELIDLERPQQFPPIRSMRRELTNLPIPLTSFVGREADLAQLRDALPQLRLLTLTGPGGAGKTRLAAKLGWEFVTYYPDGVWLVELGALTDQRLVAKAVADVLELREQPGRPLSLTLREQLAERRLLLLLDNCEHVAGATAELITDLLQSCEHLQVLATSREPLRIAGEAVRRVPSLGAEEALQLFAARARLQEPAFEISDENIDTVARICKRLDGLPLAIELAAARVAMMPVTEILAHLEERFGLLTGGDRAASTRLQTLRAAIDWSYDLLAANEQTLFRRVCAFAGRFSLEAVERVCAGDDLRRSAVLDALGGLVEKSMVVAEEARYRCLETLREYGRERLIETRERDGVEAALTRYIVELAEGRSAGRLAEWLDRLESWHDDVMATMEWTLDHDFELGARLAAALPLYFQLRGHASDPRNFAEALLRRLKSDSPRWPGIVHIAGMFAYVLGDLEMARRRLAEAVTAAQVSGDPLTEARALETVGLVEVAGGDVAAAENALQAALRLAEAHGDREGEAAIVHQLGLLSSRRADYGRARALFERSIEIRRALGRADEASMPLTFLAAVALLDADLERSRRAIMESLQIGRMLRDRRAAWSMQVLACIVAIDGQMEVALRIAGAAASIHDAAGSRPLGVWNQTIDMLLQPARESLGQDRATAAWDAGKHLGMIEAFDLALEAGARPVVVAS
jgi:predicted ATPase/class 3 adenylate cyclase/tellurite resistance protein